MRSRDRLASILRGAFALGFALTLSACAGHAKKPPQPPQPPPSHAPAAKPARKPFKPQGPYTPGGVYAPDIADGAPSELPDVANLPEPVPHPEPLSRYGNRSPYSVLGKTYTVLPTAAGYDERGVASWYGTKFDGRMTSSLEPYDLAQFSAAHRTLPLPSYARVTNLENGRSVIVRINDRGPFHDGRLIDLSYAAAIKLGVNVHGTAMVEVRGIDTSQPVPVEPAVVSPPAPRPRAAVSTPKPIAPSPPVAQAASLEPALPAANPPNAAATAIPVAAAANDGAPPSPSAPVSSAPPNPPPAIVPTPAALTPAPTAIDPETVGFLQIGSYNDAGNANRMLARLIQAGVEHAEVVVVQVNGQNLWRVHVGPFSADEAEHVAEKLDALGFGHPPFFKK